MQNRQEDPETINRCPEQAPDAPQRYTDFRGSLCKWESTPQAWDISCNPQQPPPPGYPLYWYNGNCDPGTICHVWPVNRSLWRYGVYATAGCVPVGGMVLVARSYVPTQVRRLSLRPTIRYLNAISLVLVESRNGQMDNSVYVQAAHMSIIARDASNNILDIGSECGDCNHLSLRNIPPWATNFDLNITMPHAEDEAYLQPVLFHYA